MAVEVELPQCELLPRGVLRQNCHAVDGKIRVATLEEVGEGDADSHDVGGPSAVVGTITQGVAMTWPVFNGTFGVLDTVLRRMAVLDVTSHIKITNAILLIARTRERLGVTALHV